MTDEHNALGQCWLWSGGQDHIPDDEVERLLEYHDGYGFHCEGCGQMVHGGGLGWNEQDMSYVRYGPYFICAECILNCVDLPEIPWGEEW